MKRISGKTRISWLLLLAALAIGTLLVAACQTDTDDPVTPSSVVKTALINKITDAESVMTDVIEAEDDSGLSVGDSWAVPAAFTALNNAIADAQAVADDDDATQTQVDEAVSTLNEAITTFSNAVNTVQATGTGGTGISVTFDGIPEDKSITLNDVPSAGTLTVTVEEIFVSYEWYMDGIIISDEDEVEITLDLADYLPGTHKLAVKVKTADGAIYSKSLTFTVEL